MDFLAGVTEATQRLNFVNDFRIVESHVYRCIVLMLCKVTSFVPKVKRPWSRLQLTMFAQVLAFPKCSPGCCAHDRRVGVLPPGCRGVAPERGLQPPRRGTAAMHIGDSASENDGIANKLFYDPLAVGSALFEL